MSFALLGFSQDSLTVEEITPAEATVENVTDQVSSTTAAEEIVEGLPAEGNFDIPEKIIDLATSLTWWDFLFVLIFTLLGYISPFIPGLRKIGDTEIRVVVGGIVLIMIFVAMDFNSALLLVIEFVAATKLYEHVFSLIKKTPKPTVEATILKE